MSVRSLVLGLLLLVAPAGASAEPLDTWTYSLSVPCTRDQPLQRARWGTLHEVRIRGIDVLFNTSYGLIADVAATIWIERVGAPNTFLLLAGWDRYQEPVGPVTVSRTFAPDYYTWRPGEHLNVYYHCNAFLGPLPHAGALWFISLRVASP